MAQQQEQQGAQGVQPIQINMGNVGRHLNNMCQQLKATELIDGIRRFDGECHMKFQDWLADMERCHAVVGDDDERMRNLTLRSLRGAAAEFATRGVKENPTATWEEIKTTMEARYSDLSDAQYSKQTLRKLQQTADEPVENFGERILTRAQFAYPGQDINHPIAGRAFYQRT